MDPLVVFLSLSLYTMLIKRVTYFANTPVFRNVPCCLISKIKGKCQTSYRLANGLIGTQLEVAVRYCYQMTYLH